MPRLILHARWEWGAGVSSENVQCPCASGVRHCRLPSLSPRARVCVCTCACVRAQVLGDLSPSCPILLPSHQEQPVPSRAPCPPSFLSPQTASGLLSCACIFIGLAGGFAVSSLLLLLERSNSGRETETQAGVHADREIECGSLRLGNVSQDSRVVFSSPCLKDPGKDPLAEPSVMWGLCTQRGGSRPHHC